MKKIAFLFLSVISLSINASSQTNIDSLNDYTGQYVFPDGSVVPNVDVILDNGALSMHSVAGSSTLTKLGIDSFTIVEFQGLAAFKRDENMKVNAIHIEAMGYILDGKKQENGSWSFSILFKENFAELLSKK